MKEILYTNLKQNQNNEGKFIMKHYLLGMVILSTVIACTPKEDKVNLDNIKDVREEVNQMAEDNQSVNNFFANEEYDGGKEEDQCIEDNIGTFQGLASCHEKSIAIIKENIKKKLKLLNKPQNILETEYQKIKNKCQNKILKMFKDDGLNKNDDAPLFHLSTSDCVKHDLYQFGRKLK